MSISIWPLWVFADRVLFDLLEVNHRKDYWIIEMLFILFFQRDVMKVESQVRILSALIVLRGTMRRIVEASDKIYKSVDSR